MNYRSLIFINFFLIPIFILCSGRLFSQVGLEFTYHRQHLKDWNEVLKSYYHNENSIFFDNYGAGVYYWFRVPNYRIEFTPGLTYSYSKSISSYQEIENTYSSHTAGIEADVNIYPFEFEKRTYERDCPSFSNRGEWFSKGFFFQVSPGINYSFYDMNGTSLKETNLFGKFDFGAGLDIKISHSIIMAPIIKYGMNLGKNWEGFSEFHGGKNYNDASVDNFWSLTLSFYLK